VQSIIQDDINKLMESFLQTSMLEHASTFYACRLSKMSSRTQHLWTNIGTNGTTSINK